MLLTKRQRGAYYTKGNLFTLKPFVEWARVANLATGTVLEPFAGANNITRMLSDAHMCSKFATYDIDPVVSDITQCDTLKQFPTGYKICITNPPWLARNSACRRGLAFPAPACYDDLYKYALELALSSCRYVAFIIPATFLRSGLFRERLESFVLIERQLFDDTDNPVCLALFTPDKQTRTRVWADDKFIGYLDDLERIFYTHTRTRTNKIRFNVPDGKLGLHGVDNTKEPSIRFCHGFELSHRTVRHSDRSITRIDPGVKVTSDLIDGLNDALNQLRCNTHDIFMAPFKGLRADGRYRRRLDYDTARGLITRWLIDRDQKERARTLTLSGLVNLKKLAEPVTTS